MQDYRMSGPNRSRQPPGRAALRSAFHASGLRLTRQRLAICRELGSRGDHPDVDRLYRAVKPRIPQISLFTVYRTVNALEAAGLIRRVATWKGHARYDFMVASHGHFLCETCGRIDDVDLAASAPIAAEAVGGIKGTARRVDVMISGECAACAAGRAAGASPA